MPDILHNFIVKAPASKVFEGVSTPGGLDTWWTKKSKGNPAVGEEYELYFGPKYDWRAVVSKCTHNKQFELKMTKADAEWRDSQIGFVLNELDAITHIEFYHKGWREINEHFRISSFCWAMYLRILKRNIEFGETVPYEKRLDV